MITKQIKIFLISLSYFTRIPLPEKLNLYDIDSASHILRYFPLIGILIGTICYLIFHLFHNILGTTSEISIILVMIFSTMITGALHEDGLADSADGFGGGYGNKEKIITIMRDSRIGSFGALALILSQLLKFYSLKAIIITDPNNSNDLLFFTLILAHGLSRLFVCIYVFNNKYSEFASSSSISSTPSIKNNKSLAVTSSENKSDLLIAIFTVVVVIVLIAMAVITTLTIVASKINTLSLLKTFSAALILILIYFTFKGFIKKRLAGYTGDTLGAFQQIIEITIYILIPIICLNMNI